MVLGALLTKDVRLLARNRALLAALLVYPFLLALVLGAAFQEPPQMLDLAVVDLDRSGATLDVGGTPIGVADLLDAARPFARVHAHVSEDDALRVLRAGDVDAVLVVPEGFMDELSRLGASASLRLIVDESDPVRAGVARNAVEGAVEKFIDRIVEKKIADVVALLRLTVDGGDLLGSRVLGIEASLTRLREVNATLVPGGPEAAKVTEVIAFLEFASDLLGNSEQFLTSTALPVMVRGEGLTTRSADLASVALPGALVLGVFWTGSLAAALLTSREREAGVDRRLAAVSRTRIWQLLSKALVALGASLLPAIILLALGIFLLGAQVSSPALALLALALAGLAAAALGGLAATLTRGSGAAALVVVLALVPMLLLGGLFYPIAYMPPAARAVAGVLPITLATDALRGATLRASSFAAAAPELVGLAAVAVFLTAGIWLFGRRAP